MFIGELSSGQLSSNNTVARKALENSESTRPPLSPIAIVCCHVKDKETESGLTQKTLYHFPAVNMEAEERNKAIRDAALNVWGMENIKKSWTGTKHWLSRYSASLEAQVLYAKQWTARDREEDKREKYTENFT